MRASVRTFDTHAKDGVRCAIALGMAMYAFQSIGTHNSFWVMLTVFVILAPNGRTTLQKAAIRVVGTLVGVSAVVGLSEVLPPDAALPLAVRAQALSLAASSRSTTVSAALALAAGYLLWPRSKDLAAAVPDNLTADASTAGVAAIGR